MAGLDERAISHAMLIAGNVLCLLAQSELEAVGIDGARWKPPWTLAWPTRCHLSTDCTHRGIDTALR